MSLLTAVVPAFVLLCTERHDRAHDYDVVLMEVDAETKKKLLYGLSAAAGTLLLYKLLKPKQQDQSYLQIISRKRGLRDAAVQAFTTSAPSAQIQSLILHKSVTELKQGLASGLFTSEDLVLTFIRRTIEIGVPLEAVTDVNFEEALRVARKCDTERREGRATGLLHGIPISIKDNFHMKGFDSTCGLTANCFKPSEEDGLPVLAVRLQGGIPFVKSNLPFAVVAYDSTNQLWGSVKNPWKHERTSGGSSGGEATLVATACSPLGLANDLAGSIRFPCSVTGLYGFVCSPERGHTDGEHKITQPHGGQFTPYEWGRAGPIGRSVDDLVLMMKTLWSDEVFERDRLIPRLPFNDTLYQGNGQVVVALVESSLWELPVSVKRALSEAAAALQSLGHRVVKVDVNIAEVAQNFYEIMTGGDFWNTVDSMRGSEPLSPAAQGAVAMSKLSGLAKRFLFAKMRWTGNGKLADLVANFGVKSSYDLMGLLGKRNELIRKVIGQLQAVGAQALLMPATITPAPILCKGSLCELANVHIIAATHLTFPTGAVPVTVVKEEEQAYAVPKGDAVAQSIAEAVAGSAGLPLGVQLSALPFQDELCLRLMRELQEVLAFQCRP